MTRYVISDLHLDHANIIEYCDRPFDDVTAMNTQLCANWNRVVDAGDTVFVVGDLVMGSHECAMEFVRGLNGSIVLIEGNHDSVDATTAPFPVVTACEVQFGKYRFHCTHRPENAPRAAEWVLYGHHHNNDVQTYPFVDPQNNRVNVSAELLQYTPLSVEELLVCLNQRERLLERPL